jgi:energy-coupling factor transport system ATP-binding protein
LRLQGLTSADVSQRVDASLAAFGLTDQKQTPPAVLGAGQRRQVALAAIMATEPEILILDEPTGGLDRHSSEELMRIVAQYHRLGRTILLITHDMATVAQYAGRAVVLLAGQILFDGLPAALFGRRDLIRRAQLSVPPIARLSQRSTALGFPSGIASAGVFAAAWQRILLATSDAPARDTGGMTAPPPGDPSP